MFILEVIGICIATLIGLGLGFIAIVIIVNKIVTGLFK